MRSLCIVRCRPTKPIAFSTSLLATLISAYCSPAFAEAAGRVGVQSDYLLHGASLSRGRSVATLSMFYDFPTGPYVGASVLGALSSPNYPGLVGLTADVGYAHRLNSELSLDVGVAHSLYARVSRNPRRINYTEIFGGLATRHLSARLYYSPEYFRRGAKTLYGEINGNIGQPDEIILHAHLGTLAYVDSPPTLAPARTQHDWRIAASRQFNAVDLHVALSGGGPTEPAGYALGRPKTEFVFGAGYAF